MKNIQIASTVGIAEFLEQIYATRSITDVLAFIKKIDALKVALDAADTFHSQAIKYAKLEASALIRAVELGGLNSLRGLHKKTAEWLSGLNEQEKEKYILMCEDGLTIDQVFKREVGDAQALSKKIKTIEQEREWLIEDCKEKGIVDIKPFSDSVKEAFKYEHQSLCKDILDGARNRLRRAGAVGIGDDSGIYVMPCPENGEEIKKAILLRYESICSDFDSIRKIASASGVKISYTDFDSGANWSFHNKNYIIHVLIALIRMGFILDEEECYKAIAKSDFREETEVVTKQLKFSRAEYIKAQYKRLMENEEANDEF